MGLQISINQCNLKNQWLPSYHIDGLVQDYHISIANAMETLQSCTKPSTHYNSFHPHALQLEDWQRLQHGKKYINHIHKYTCAILTIIDFSSVLVSSIGKAFAHQCGGGATSCSQGWFHRVDIYQTWSKMATPGKTSSEIDGFVQERCNSIAYALELHLSCTHPWRWCLEVMSSKMAVRTGSWTTTTTGHKNLSLYYSGLERPGVTNPNDLVIFSKCNETTML